MKKILTLLFASLLSAHAGHGDTAPWTKKMSTLADAQKALVPNQSLPHRWSEDGPHLLFKATRDDRQKSYQLDLDSGEITETPFEADQPESISPDIKNMPKKYAGHILGEIDSIHSITIGYRDFFN